MKKGLRNLKRPSCLENCTLNGNVNENLIIRNKKKKREKSYKLSKEAFHG